MASISSVTDNNISKSLIIRNKTIRVRTDGYINATDICSACNKRMTGYRKRIITKSFLASLSVDIGIGVDQLVIWVRKGNQGIWIHPRVLIHLIMWVDESFLVHVTKWVEEWKNSSGENRDEFVDKVQKIEPSELDSKEAQIQQRLHEKLGGVTEVETDLGFIDLLTDNKLIEIKYGPKWKSAIGQLVAYGTYYPKHSKILYLFDYYGNHKNEIMNICSNIGISVKFV